MSPFPNQQLQLVIAQLDHAIYRHEQWYKHLLRVLISHVPPELTDLMPNAHRQCDFGKWYEGPQMEFLQEHPVFISLGKAHEKMHDSARLILQKNAKGLPISLNCWDQFEHKLDRMRLDILALRQEFAMVVQNQDPLTGSQTRANMFSELQNEQALVQRGQQECGLIMLDLDHFKLVNDKYGHAVGDVVLVSTVKCLKTFLRKYDKIYRYGGEEFLICLPGTTVEQAYKVAERMRVAVAAQKIKFDGSDQYLQITASFGVESLAASRSVEASIDQTDKAMYKAKASGRNIVNLGTE